MSTVSPQPRIGTVRHAADGSTWIKTRRLSVEEWVDAVVAAHGALRVASAVGVPLGARYIEAMGYAEVSRE